ncbi:MCE family protein [Candidatus Cytomitobacter indipagum]|uniref:MCE family protein n=1 Tax=Candidatus Cytomitobacter indipagum TaxID=2601575 RepID=A0A5C0UDG1_9PROT|nr:MlaD family protein [Candidatus Cytomitobacter indipagum]QEK38028.1 MCE family protein [Candidatus Cytomitobacter indipagum]
MSNFNKRFFNKKAILFILFAVIPILVGLSCYFHDNFRNKHAYIIAFDENVSGLELGSSVLFNGVSVGYIRDIAINPDNDKVNIVIMISNSMKTDNKVAQIQSQGLSGHKYINLAKDNVGKLGKFHGFQQISSKKSDLSKIMDRAPMIADQTHNLIEKLNDIDLKMINNILCNLNNIMKKIDKIADKSSKSIDKMSNILNNLNNIANNLHYSTKDSKSNMQDFFLTSVPKLNSSISNLNDILDDASKIMNRFKEKPVKFLLDWYS